MGFGHAQVGQQLSDTFGGHAAAPVGMQSKLLLLDQLSVAGFAGQALGQFGRLAVSYYPTHDTTAEDVDDDVEVKIGPFGGAFELGDLPRPHLIRCGGGQLHSSLV